MNNSVIIDYLSYTFSLDELHGFENFSNDQYINNQSSHPFVSNLMNLLGFKEEEISHHEFGRNRFKSKIILGDDITILFNGPHNKNDNVMNMLEMTGSGCRTFSERGGNWYNLLDFLIRHGDFKFTRLDIATDLINNPHITMKWLINKIDRGEYITKFNSLKYIVSNKRQTSAVGNKSYSIYFGSKSSNKNLVIYDKLKERISKGETILCTSWIRFESRFYKDCANDVVCELINGRLDNFSQFHSELLNGLIEFKNPGIDISRKKNWPTSSYWKTFIGNVPKFKFNSHHKKRVLKIDSKEKWFKTSASKSLLLLLGVGDTDETSSILISLIAKKIMTLTSVDLVAVNEARESKGKRIYKDVEELTKHLIMIKNNLYNIDTYTLENGDEIDLPF